MTLSDKGYCVTISRNSGGVTISRRKTDCELTMPVSCLKSKHNMMTVTGLQKGTLMMMIAFISFKSSLVPLFEGL